MNGGIIGMPTETVYGLAARALDEKAVHRVFDVKGRPRNHPLIVHLPRSTDASVWGRMNREAELLADGFWPGPLTILVDRTDLVPDWVTGGRDSVALRVPSHPLCAELLRICNDGIVAPSANRFGSISPTTAAHVVDDLGTDLDLVLDGGPCLVERFHEHQTCPRCIVGREHSRCDRCRRDRIRCRSRVVRAGRHVARTGNALVPLCTAGTFGARGIARRGTERRREFRADPLELRFDGVRTHVVRRSPSSGRRGVRTRVRGAAGTRRNRTRHKGPVV